MRLRTGLIAKKVGMTHVYTERGNHVPVTLLEVKDCQVIGHKTEEKDGYNAVVVGAFNKKAKNVAKPQKQQFAKLKVEPKAKVVEFRIDKDAFADIGIELGTLHFMVGQKVDTTSTSIGKGFAGGMKRHGFAGLEASHGVSISHRSHGSTGQCQDPGRVFKGKKMAGQMGNVQVTAQNLEVVANDEDAGIIAIKGAIPGSKGTYVLIKDAVKSAQPEAIPFPAGRKGGKKAAEAAKAAAEEATKKAEEEAVRKAAEQEALKAAEAKAAEKAASDKEDGGAEGKAEAAPKEQAKEEPKEDKKEESSDES